MKKITRLLTLSLAAGFLAVSAPYAAGQDYEDDLYYSPSRAEKQRKEREAAERARLQAQAAADQAAGLGAADTYTSGSSDPLSMDVDTYNRRNASVSAGSAPETANFSYTRRIERFYNPDVVSASGDTTLMDYYYASPSQQDINVYVINNVDPVGSYNPWPAYNYLWTPYNAWNYGWTYPSFSWGWNFGPFYAGWSWGYDPFWSIGWNYNPWWNHGWCWYPHNHWYPSYRPSHWGYNRPGASRPHNPSYSGGNGYVRPGSRPAGNTHSSGTTRPGYTRPGNFGRPGNTVPAGNYNPAGQNSHMRPGNSGNIVPSNNDRRGRNNNSNHYTAPLRNNSGHNNSYNRGTHSPGRNSGGSYRSPGSGSRGGGGGVHHGGGGGGSRGRGR